MSANSYSQCPQCELISCQEKKQHQKLVKSSYGKVSQEEYEKLKKQVPKARNDDSLGDYSQMYFQEDKLKIHIEFSCSECGFSIHERLEMPVKFKISLED